MEYDDLIDEAVGPLGEPSENLSELFKKVNQAGQDKEAREVMPPPPAPAAQPPPKKRNAGAVSGRRKLSRTGDGEFFRNSEQRRRVLQQFAQEDGAQPDPGRDTHKIEEGERKQRLIDLLSGADKDKYLTHKEFMINTIFIGNPWWLKTAAGKEWFKTANAQLWYASEGWLEPAQLKKKTHRKKKKKSKSKKKSKKKKSKSKKKKK